MRGLARVANTTRAAKAARRALRAFLGTVIFFDNDKRFGFISPSDGSEDVFVHANDVTGQHVLRKGDEVGASFWGVAESLTGFSSFFRWKGFPVLSTFGIFNGFAGQQALAEGDEVGGASMAFESRLICGTPSRRSREASGGIQNLP